MATSQVAPNMSAKSDSREVENTVAKFLSNDAHKTIAYAQTTIVNNLWEELDIILNRAQDVQDEFENSTTFRIDFLQRACIALAKVEARNRVNEFEREIDSWSKQHKTVKLSREEIALEVIKSKSGKRMLEMSDAGKMFLDSLK